MGLYLNRLECVLNSLPLRMTPIDDEGEAKPPHNVTEGKEGRGRMERGGDGEEGGKREEGEETGTVVHAMHATSTLPPQDTGDSGGESLATPKAL